MADPLARFRDRPDPGAEPPPPEALVEDGAPRVFVVQQHDASTMHFDLRLEIGGTLVSWAVPKGPSTDPREKRLAVRVEDHERSYGDFEGSIAEDSYGGGDVIVWDAGPFHVIVDDTDDPTSPAEALAGGHLKVWLDGHKLRGGWLLQHAKVGGDHENWLLIKLDDAGADARRDPVSTEPESVLSGRRVGDGS